jgi:hypothetical protein
VHMVDFNVQLKHSHAVLRRDFLSGKPRNVCERPQTCPLGKHEMERIFAFRHVPTGTPYAMLMANNPFHFSHFPCSIASAHVNQPKGECANYAAHSLIIKECRNREVISNAYGICSLKAEVSLRNL